MYPSTVPSLPYELIEDVLSTSIRINLHSQPLRDHTSTAQRILRYLNTLPRATIAAVSRAVLFQLPWISLDLAARLGNLWMLDTLLHWHHVHPLQFTTKWLVGAAEAGHVPVFEWWKSKQSSMVQGQAFPVQCEVHGIVDVASKHGRVELLKWWKAHVLDPLTEKNKTVVDEYYTTKAVDEASSGGHVACLEWWLKESGLFIKFTGSAIRTALTNGHHEVLEWWGRSGLDFKGKAWHDDRSTLTATALKNKDLRGFQWLVAHDLVSFSNMTALCSLTDDANMSFFHACTAIVASTPLSSSTSLTRTHLPDPPAYQLATEAGRVDMLNHLRSLHKLPNRKTILHYFKIASECGHPQVLKWWLDKASSLRILKFDSTISKLVHVAAAAAGHTHVLDWWSPLAIATFADSAAPMSTPTPTMTPGRSYKTGVYILDFDAVNKAAANGHLNVLQWFWSWAGRHGQPIAYGTLKKAYVCYYALVSGHVDVIRWAATKRGFSGVPSAKVADAMTIAARNGYWEAMQAYVEGFYRFSVQVHIIGADVDLEEEVSTTWAGSNTVEVEDQVAWWKRIPELVGSSDYWITDSLIQASRRGDLTTLNWWMAQGVVPRMSSHHVQQAMAAASMKGHVDCLDWWCLVGTRTMANGTARLTFEAQLAFSSNAQVDCFVLEWWMASPFRFFGDAAHVYYTMIRFGQVQLLEMAMKNWDKLAMERYDGRGVYDLAARLGQVAVQDWWHRKQQRPRQQHDHDHGALIEVFRPALSAASMNSHLPVLEWWKHSSGVACMDQVPFSADQVVARLSHCPKALNWWLESGLLPDQDVDALDEASEGHDSEDDEDDEDDDGYGEEYGDYDGSAMFDEWCDMMYETSLGLGFDSIFYGGW